MNIKLRVIENFRQIQIAMIQKAYQGNKSHSSFRGQGRILEILKSRAEISRTELGERMQMSRAALAELLRKMESNGLIVRSQLPADKRKNVIMLTENGKAAAEEASLEKSPLPDMLNCLDGAELNQLNELLGRIVEYNRKQLEEAGNEPSAAEDSLIRKSVVDPVCEGCPGPAECKHDYIRYGHTRPNPEYCKYADLFPF